MYLVIAFCIDSFGETYSFSREIATDDLQTIFTHMKTEGNFSSDEIDSLILVRNGESGSRHFDNPPHVVKYWTSGNGDFDLY